MIYIDSKGYWTFCVGSNRGKRVHRWVAEQMLGRALRRDEVVHHRDGNKLNCSPGNLQVMGEREHNAVSAKQRWYLKQHDIHLYKQWEDYFADSVHG